MLKSSLKTGAVVFPGTVLVDGPVGNDCNFSSGTGVYIRPSDGSLVASLWGSLTVSGSPPEDKQQLSVAVGLPSSSGAQATRSPNPKTTKTTMYNDILHQQSHGHSTVPQVNDVVTCVVGRVTGRHANVSVLCVGEKALASPFQGIIRRQDIRATEIDQVVTHECFRPGDVVLARVLSLGDRKSLFLSTAANDLGVVYARSQAVDEPMVPVGWTSMQCPKTKTMEPRKVAKVWR